MKAYDDYKRLPRHRKLVSTSVEDARSSLFHYTEADLDTLKQAIKAELKKGPGARATMVQLLKSTIQRLEKQAWKKQQEVPDESV
jgi:hypothetical protein